MSGLRLIYSKPPEPGSPEVRTTGGRLAGWVEGIPTQGGISSTHVFAICLECGVRIRAEKGQEARVLGWHRGSRWGSDRDRCEAPIHVWLTKRAEKIAAERRFDFRALAESNVKRKAALASRRSGKSTGVIQAIERELGKPLKVKDSDLDFALCTPLRRVFGEAWPARYWAATLEQIDAEFVRAVAAISEGGILEAQ